MQHQPLFNDSYLRALWTNDYEEFRSSEAESQLIEHLKNWADRDIQKETSAASALLDTFFKKTWGYTQSGHTNNSDGYTCWPEYSVEGAGATGSTGYADLALGWFGNSDKPSVPQVLCEFKDIRSGLDVPQNRKENGRSPVEQCNDYLHGARQTVRREFNGNPRVRPAWGIVTDMNEFRIFHIDSGFTRYQRFVIDPKVSSTVGLLDDTPAASFQRFVFSRLFQPDLLLSDYGPSTLERRLEGQSEHEKSVEEEFYEEYRTYREHIYETLVEANPDFPGTNGDLVRLTQTFLDRCIFALYCEDMGRALNFPPNLLRDVLQDVAQSNLVSRDDNEAWSRVQRLFDTMRDGGEYGKFAIDRFNGGLFETSDRLQNLKIPTHIFCEPGQVGNIADYPKTLLYLSEMYNFGATGKEGESAISLYTLGRIFEQSITELEIMEAEAEGRPSLNKITKRKRNGVYYTPERIVDYIVSNTIGERLAELKAKTGVDEYGPVVDEEARDFIENKDLRTSEHTRINNYREALEKYRDALEEITVVDPACGSGAFLIAALDQLLQANEWVIDEHNRITGQVEIFDQDAVTKSILSHNLYGVDVNAESVEITKLALWLNTALPGKPLSALNHTIRCGNSLVGPELEDHVQLELLSEGKRQQINVFDWQEAFPEVFADGGFDVVLGNPPYVKLQHFRKVHSEVAEYLVEAESPDGTPLYRSTQIGNFDLYLPFIEKGLHLLKDGGRLGYIAPSVWQKNDYGEGLRELLHETQWLDRWLDFGSHQIFEEATTYTALQFYRKTENDGITFTSAPNGTLGSIKWDNEESIPYDQLPKLESWNLQPRTAFELIERLAAQFDSLGEVANRIFQGLITSADAVYHLRRVGENLYEPKRGGERVEIEDEIMRPLVSGPEAKRFRKPKTEIYILFPYNVEDGDVSLMETEELESRFPKAWEYLKRHEDRLRGRESNRFDVPGWYQFGRSQNLDKQDFSTLIVAQTVPCMRVSYDEEGDFCLNNVRVNGILADSDEERWLLLALLNSTLVDFVFRRIAKPKDNNFFEANKQFIAPLPIAKPEESDRTKLIGLSKMLQRLHTTRRNLLDQVDRRLTSHQTSNDAREKSWIWGAKCEWRDWKDEAPNFDRRKHRNDWCRDQVEEFLDKKYSDLQHALNNRGKITVQADDGELILEVGGERFIEGVFAEDDATWIAVQWRHKIRSSGASSRLDAKRLVNEFLKLRATSNHKLRERVMGLDKNLTELENEILRVEADLDELVYELYDLTDEERSMVEADKRPVL